ncbi:MAG: cytochrome C oxidase subunit IV family protein [Kofleriaceae bacterium]|nr:cytochrome C oxidase subunit IV family protein [Myxococcales bacterium]MCB9559296.1 cytochrome C oxidase subunit IV family protein [Kofleriaceae bacterium]
MATAPKSHDHHDDHHHGIAHVASVRVLLTTWITLMFLTVITVLATKVDFGPSMNLAIAMAIAAIKATLVILFFMHLFYDKLFHSVLIIGGLLAASLFVGFALMDSGQYQDSIRWDVPAGTP